jgi:hypothetical protein
VFLFAHSHFSIWTSNSLSQDNSLSEAKEQSGESGRRQGGLSVYKPRPSMGGDVAGDERMFRRMLYCCECNYCYQNVSPS